MIKGVAERLGAASKLDVVGFDSPPPLLPQPQNRGGQPSIITGGMVKAITKIPRTNTKLKRCALNESLKKDVQGVIGSIYRFNAPWSIGYLFNSTADGKSISRGMYCNRLDEIDYCPWEYFVKFGSETELCFKLYKMEDGK